MQYDVIIVGGGSAGCVLAARLSEGGRRSVLLVEAGAHYRELGELPNELRDGNAIWSGFGGPHDWAYRGSPMSSRPDAIGVPRGKVMGGSSSVNAMIALRGTPEDFDLWTSYGLHGWSFDDVLPYYNRLETDADFPDADFHGDHGPIPVRRIPPADWSPLSATFHAACLARGWPAHPDQNAPGSTGVSPRPFNNRDGVRVSTSIAYLTPALHRDNLTVLPRASVRRVIVRDRRAIGIEVGSADGVEVVEAREVVLATGAIATPQLLMLSGIGEPAQLTSFGIDVLASLPGVGKNLRDHPHCLVPFRGPAASAVGNAPPMEVVLRYTASGSRQANDMMVGPVWMAGDRAAIHRADIHDDRSDRADYPATVGLQLAESAGELRLRSGDPDVLPTIDFDYLAHPEDRRRMREGVRLTVELFREQAMGDLINERLAPSDPTLGSDDLLDEWLRESVSTQHHASGTAKMGPVTDPLAVVDDECRVHGIDGLRVVDASVMPNVVRANTNITTIMIAERAAEWISHSAL